MTTELQIVTYKARTHPEHVFQNLSSLLDEGLMYESWGQLKKAEWGTRDMLTRVIKMIKEPDAVIPHVRICVWAAG